MMERNPDGDLIVHEVRCADCGRKYGDENWIDVIIPDEVWEKIGGIEAGILCGGCIANRVARLETSPGVPLFAVGRLTFE